MEKKKRNVITQKEYNDLFKAISYLYGVIDSDDIHYLLKHYYEKITKKEIEAQLKKLYEKPKKDYFAARIINTPSNKFYLIFDALDDNEIEEIISQIGDKELFVPKTKEDLLKFKDDHYMTEKEDEYYTQLFKYLSKRNNSKNKEAYAELYISYLHIKNKIDAKVNNNNNPFEELDKMGFFIKDEKDAQKFLNLYMNCANNTKMYPNRGWSPYELMKMSPKVDINEVQLGIGDGMKKMFREQDFDVEDALNQVRNSDLPQGIKESLINELNLILNERKNKA